MAEIRLSVSATDPPDSAGDGGSSTRRQLPEGGRVGALSDRAGVERVYVLTVGENDEYQREWGVFSTLELAQAACPVPAEWNEQTGVLGDTFHRWWASWESEPAWINEYEVNRVYA